MVKPMNDTRLNTTNIILDICEHEPEIFKVLTFPVIPHH